MGSIFAYCRVDRWSAPPSDQLEEIEAAGILVKPQHVVTEEISGSMPAIRRPAFFQLIERLGSSDGLVVTNVDGLGKGANDVRLILDYLARKQVSVYCLALGVSDLNGPEGAQIRNVVAAFGDFDRDLLLSRIRAGREQAKARGKKLGRPPALSPAEQQRVMLLRARGASARSIAAWYGVGRATIQRIEANGNNGDQESVVR